MARLNLTVAEDVPDLLTELAGGERKRGDYLTDLVRELAQREDAPPEEVIEGLRLQVVGLAGLVGELDRRLKAVEREIAQDGV